jgi:hypothetical protein
MIDLDAATALDWMTRLVCVPLILGGLEQLWLRREFGRGGLLDWHLTSMRPVTRPLDRLLRSPRIRMILTPRGTVALGLALAAGALALMCFPRMPLLAILVVLAHTAIGKRHHQSVEGSDDMIMVLLGVTVLRGLSPDLLVQQFAVGFVAAQLCVSYLTAGLSKMQGREWWSGAAMPRTMSTDYFGHRPTAVILWRFRAAAIGLSWAIFLWEATFLVSIVAPRPIALVALLIGLGFHVGCAITMHLGAFVWAFGAAYPCFMVVNAAIVDTLTPIARLAIGLGLLAVIGAVGGFFAGQAVSGPIRVPVPAPRPRRRGAAQSPAPVPTTVTVSSS